MSTSELFKKHFNDTGVVGIFHPNIEAFFDELSKECLREQANKPEKDGGVCPARVRRRGGKTSG
jgi:hypothetical protein